MFVRLLITSLTRRRSRKMVAVLAVWIGVTLIVGLLALSLDVGDKMNRELSSLGANIKIEAATAAVPVRVGGNELTHAVGSMYLEEARLAQLKTIFWANNILEVRPLLWTQTTVGASDVTLLGVRFDQRPPHWKVDGAWPTASDECLIGASVARQLGLAVGETLAIGPDTLRVAGTVTTGGAEDGAIIASLATVQAITGLNGKISEADVSALTTPDNTLAAKYHLDPTSLTPTEYERWSCTPYPGPVAADIQRAIPGSVARVVRRVSESQGVVLTRIEGLVGLLGALAAIACALSVMGVLTSAVLERRTEVALLQAIGAHGTDVLRLFATEAGILGLVGGTLGGISGIQLGRWLVAVVFASHSEPHAVLMMIAPFIGLLTALAASALPVLQIGRQDTAQVLHGC